MRALLAQIADESREPNYLTTPSFVLTWSALALLLEDAIERHDTEHPAASARPLVDRCIDLIRARDAGVDAYEVRNELRAMQQELEKQGVRFTDGLNWSVDLSGLELR